MIMYYAYERVWTSIAWGRNATPCPMTWKEKILWSLGTVAALVLIFFLLLVVLPNIKEKQPGNKGMHVSSLKVAQTPLPETRDSNRLCS